MQRLRDLAARAQAMIPELEVAVSPGVMDQATMTVTFPGGWAVHVAGDADLPQALFEVVRFVEPGDPPKLHFEARASYGTAYSDKLASSGVLTLLADYAALGARGPKGVAP